MVSSPMEKQFKTLFGWYMMPDKLHQIDNKLSPLCWGGCRVSGKLNVYYELEGFLRQNTKGDERYSSKTIPTELY